MLPFRVEVTAGESPYRQVVHAASRAIVSGHLAVGAPFPSVRTLSQSLKLNPNTAQKAVAELVRAGLLEVRPGVGTVVAAWEQSSADVARALPDEELARLLVDARRHGLDRADVHAAVDRAWRELFGDIHQPEKRRAETAR